MCLDLQIFLGIFKVNYSSSKFVIFYSKLSHLLFELSRLLHVVIGSLFVSISILSQLIAKLFIGLVFSLCLFHSYFHFHSLGFVLLYLDKEIPNPFVFGILEVDLVIQLINETFENLILLSNPYLISHHKLSLLLLNDCRYSLLDGICNSIKLTIVGHDLLKVLLSTLIQFLQ